MFATALIGTSTMPRLSAARAQNAMRSIEAGAADAIADRFGGGAVDGKIQAHIIVVPC